VSLFGILEIVHHENIWKFVEFIQLTHKLLYFLLKPGQDILFKHFDLETVSEEANIREMSIRMLSGTGHILLGYCSAHKLPVGCNLVLFLIPFILLASLEFLEFS
jgi:hypothetical protein